MWGLYYGPTRAPILPEMLTVAHMSHGKTPYIGFRRGWIQGVTRLYERRSDPVLRGG